MAALLGNDLADHLAIGREGALFVLLQLPEAASIVQKLSHCQFEPRGREWDWLVAQTLVHPGIDGMACELFVHPSHRQVMLSLFSDVPDDEFEPLGFLDKLQPMPEHSGCGQLAISLALH